MRFAGSLLLVSLLITVAAPASNACGCQKKALQTMLKLQEEAERLQLPSQSLRMKARALNAVGKLADAEAAYDESIKTALAELQTAETSYKAGSGPYTRYRFALLHAAELQKERGRLQDQRHNLLAYRAYEEALQLQLKAGLSAEEMELTYQTLVTMLMQAKEFAKAEPYAQKLLSQRESSAGRFSPQVAASLQTYATILRKLGRLDEAKQAEQQSRAIASSTTLLH